VKPIHFLVNGKPLTPTGEATRRLLDILREDLGLTAAKPGCGIGRCGACAVWVDGRPTNACLAMAWQLDGCSVTTLESGDGDAAFAAVRDALARHGAVQCGYCSPGLMMTLTHAWRQEPRPDASAVLHMASGHLCRCTGYAGVRRAVQALFGEGADSDHPA
jgi:carbon-monoxide dehydrogenase small subunit